MTIAEISRYRHAECCPIGELQVYCAGARFGRPFVLQNTEVAMSYDLYIYPRQLLSAEDFAGYFSGRPNYALNDDGSEAHYHNDETGTYFYFAHYPPATDAEIEQEIADDPERANDAVWKARKAKPSAFFNMNYVRPHVFGVEAEPEVAAFLEAFPSDIEDAQADGMGDGPYTREGFLRGWNAGNRFGYRVILSRAEETPTRDNLASLADCFNMLTASSEQIAGVWSWNFARQQLEDAVTAAGRDVFVPKIMWARSTETRETISFVVWSPGIATILPGEASHVLVGLESPAASFLQRLGFRRARGPEHASFLLVPRHKLVPHVPLQTVAVDGRKLVYSTAASGAFDDATRAALDSGEPQKDAKALLAFAAPDAVLDIEIFEDLLES